MSRAKLSGFSISRQVLALSCFGLLLSGTVILTGCGNKAKVEEEVKVAPLEVRVDAVEQLTDIGDKQAEGQYLVAKLTLKNMSNKSIDIKPLDLLLENITKDESQRYSQPPEKGMSIPMGKEYGAPIKDKVFDYRTTTLHPRLELERYLVFMVPSDADVDEYQITYTNPADTTQKVTVPLASPEATVNDHRSSIPSAESAAE